MDSPAAPKVRPFSKTQLEMYQKCGVQYEFRYVKGKRKPPGVAMVRGTAVHKAIAGNFAQKRESKKDLPESVIADWARDAVIGGFAGGVILDEEEATVGVEKVRGQTVDVAVAMAKLHRREVSPAIQPDIVEGEILIEAGDTVKRQILTILDLRDVNRVIHDVKTASKSPNPDVANLSQQLSLYAYASRATGVKERGLRLTHLVVTPTGKEKVVAQDTTRTDAQISRVLGRMSAAIKGIEAGVFTPTAPDNWWCSKNWCGYWDECPFAERR